MRVTPTLSQRRAPLITSPFSATAINKISPSINTGNANRISTSLFGPGNTIASLVALEFGESETGSLKLASLLALGFILFVLSFIVLAVSRYLLRSRLKA